MIATLRLATAAGFLAILVACSSIDSLFGQTFDPTEELSLVSFQDAPEKKDPKKTEPPSDSPKKEDAKKGDPAKDLPKKDGDPKKGDPARKDGDPKKTDETKKGSSTTDLLNKSSAKKTNDKTEAQKSPYVKLQTLTGKITKFDEAGGILNLKVTQVAIVPNVTGSGRSARINQEVKTKDHDIKAMLTEDVKIRMLNPPPLYDDKGRMKRYTAKELKELKGEDTKTPGYPADTGELQPNAYVQVDLVLKKEDYKRLKSRKKSDDPLPEVPSTNLIIILAPPPPNP